jgi:hypothetical protein
LVALAVPELRDHNPWLHPISPDEFALPPSSPSPKWFHIAPCHAVTGVTFSRIPMQRI